MSNNLSTKQSLTKKLLLKHIAKSDTKKSVPKHTATPAVQKWYRSLPRGSRTLVANVLQLTESNVSAIFSGNRNIRLQHAIILSAITDGEISIKELYPEIAESFDILVDLTVKEKLEAMRVA